MVRGCPRRRSHALRQSRAVSADYSWTFAPEVIVAVVAGGGVYVRRWRHARAEAGPGAASGWRLASFLGGLSLLVVAFVSPVDRLGEQLFVMHMVQHVLILDAAAILLVLGLTKVILRPVTRRVQRLEEAAGPLGHPVFAIVLYAGGMILWHVPAAYDAALEHPALHVLEHTTFTTAGLLYWWHLLSPIRSRRRLGGLGPVAYMVSTKLIVGLLGVVLTFSPDALYDFYVHRPRLWGMSALTDQNVGGALMAFEQSVVMGIALVALFFRALSESERDELRSERYA
jgi:cytochrome c oxidase assembly factor CtaG